jgi:hypothetical protein
MTNDSQKDKENDIFELIRIADKNYRNTRLYNILTVQYSLTVYLVVVVLGISYYIQVAVTDPLVFINLFPSLFVLFIAFYSWSERKFEKTVVERNYYLILRGYFEKTRFEKFKIWRDIVFTAKAKEEPLLKALVKIKGKNPQLKLEDLYNRDNSLFSEKKLLESLLYEYNY